MFYLVSASLNIQYISTSIVFHPIQRRGQTICLHMHSVLEMSSVYPVREPCIFDFINGATDVCKNSRMCTIIQCFEANTLSVSLFCDQNC